MYIHLRYVNVQIHVIHALTSPRAVYSQTLELTSLPCQYLDRTRHGSLAHRGIRHHCDCVHFVGIQVDYSGRFHFVLHFLLVPEKDGLLRFGCVEDFVTLETKEISDRSIIVS